MNAGANHVLATAGSAYLVFLHADVTLPGNVGQLESDRPMYDSPMYDRPPFAIWINALELQGRRWGRFDVRLDSSGGSLYSRCMLGIIGQMMNWRSSLTGICTGDQGLLIDRRLFEQVGGFPAIPLMEDIDISNRLKRLAGYPARLRPVLVVSSRRWLQHGVWRTILSMWWFRLRYFLGASPQQLHDAYYGQPR